MRFFTSGRTNLSCVTQDEFAKLGSKNTLKVEMLSGGKPWVASSEPPLARRVKQVAGLTLLSTRS